MSALQNLDSLRTKAGELIAKIGTTAPGNDRDIIEAEYKQLVQDFVAAGGPSDDLIVKIGGQFFGCPMDKSKQVQYSSPLLEVFTLLDLLN